MDPVISVIMGVYNPTNMEMIDNSIHSILYQTFKNIELIICDDGSEQSVSDYLSDISQKDGRIVVIKNSVNRGLAYSLNRCISISRGEYIARQDVDDVSQEDRLEKQILFLKEHPEYSFVGSNIIRFDERGSYASFSFPEKPQAEDFLFVSPYNHGSLLFKKQDLIKNQGYRVANETKRCEDYDLFIRMYLNGQNGYNLQENLYYFREDMDSKKRRNLKYRFDEVKVRKLYFKQMGFGLRRYLFIIKPILVGLIPKSFLDGLKDCFYKTRVNKWRK